MELSGLTPGWDELVAVVRRRQDDASLDPAEQESALRLAMRLGRTSVPGTLGCSVTMADRDSRFGTPVSDGFLALNLDHVQYRYGRGPCLSAARTGRVVLVDVMSAKGRWPELSAEAQTKGVQTSLSLPLRIPGVIAALNFYGGEHAEYGAGRSPDIATLVAKCTSVLLSPALEAVVPQALAAEPVPGIAARQALIARAVQLVMERDDVDETTAYRWLALRTSADQVPLLDVVREVLAAPAGPEPS